MREDVVEFVLNLKQVRFSYSGDKEVKAKLSAKSMGDVTAGDIEVPAGVTVANKDLVLAQLSKDAKLDAEIVIESGVGYVTADEHDEKKIGVIPLDSSFTPVTRVNYMVEETRVGRLTNYDKLIFEIWTDGTIEPNKALIEASKILMSFLDQIVNPKKIEKKEEKKEDTLGAVGRLSVEEIGLPTRVANALVKAGYETVEDLANAEKEDLSKVRNLGEKSLKIVKVALAEKGVEFLRE
jgi:DNA-directed RNA polymerase subunit alpha